MIDLSSVKSGDLVWCFDYPTNPPYNICNACLYEYVKASKGEQELRRPDNGAIVRFRYIAPIEGAEP